jgi:predicted CoA-binding protein
VSLSPAQLLRGARSVLVIDWPSPEVPDSLTRAGYAVFAKGGPGPRDYTMRTVEGSEVVARPVGETPEHVDLVYVYRPQSELPGILEIAKQLGARSIWRVPGLPEEESRQARELVEATGLSYVDEVDIVDAVRSLPADQ